MAVKLKLTTGTNEPPIDRLLRPLQELAQIESAGGILLLLCTAVALVWANSPWAGSYFDLRHIHIGFDFGPRHLEMTLMHWVNDGLMVIFFFVVGLEIKREMLAGSLASPKKAALPIIAAAGGMLVPALLYLAFNAGTPAARGWGVPVATDIAFAIGVLSLLGKRVPFALKVFLATLAIADDLGAILVIAIFYTSDLNLMSLAAGGGIVGILLLANATGVRHPLAYAILGVALWGAFLISGVHTTIAGVLLALTIPMGSRINPTEFIFRNNALLKIFSRVRRSSTDPEAVMSGRHQEAVASIEVICEEAESPLHRMEHALQPLVTFLIMPVFALVNAGVQLGTAGTDPFHQPITLGIMAGLILGKQTGVFLAAWLSVHFGLAALPAKVHWRQIYGVAWLAGIGFTMSLFITGLAFSDENHLALAKIGILSASFICGVGGWLLLRFWKR